MSKKVYFFTQKIFLKYFDFFKRNFRKFNSIFECWKKFMHKNAIKKGGRVKIKVHFGINVTWQVVDYGIWAWPELDCLVFDIIFVLDGTRLFRYK